MTADDLRDLFRELAAAPVPWPPLFDHGADRFSMRVATKRRTMQQVTVMSLHLGDAFRLRRLREIYRVVAVADLGHSVYVDARTSMERRFSGAYEPGSKVVLTGFTNRKCKRQRCKARRRERLRAARGQA